MGYIRPVPYTGISTWRAHTRRNPPSQEAGVDYYCPIGTRLVAADSGVVAHVGDSIAPATGRFVTIDLDDGRRVRYLHLLRRHVTVGQRVSRGQHIADTGATGYGEADWSWNVAQTGGAHVHVTLWRQHRYTFGTNAGTLDFEAYADSTPQPAGGGASPATPSTPEEEEEDMYIANVKNGNFYLVIGKQAHALGAGSGARQSGIPIINYPDDWAVKQLKAGGVTGIA